MASVLRRIADSANRVCKANNIGVFGEIAADLGTAAYDYHRSEAKLRQEVRWVALDDDRIPPDGWQTELEAEIAAARSRYNKYLFCLNAHLETDRDEFFNFIRYVDRTKFAGFYEKAFDLISEWVRFAN
jgi:hypothetical protein